MTRKFELANGNWLIIDADGVLWELHRLGTIQDAPQSPERPAAAPQAAKPEPPVKRGRGRPRKTAVVIPGEELKGEDEKGGDKEEFTKCRVCGQEIVTSIYGVHFENCRAARQGYTSHEAVPGKP